MAAKKPTRATLESLLTKPRRTKELSLGDSTILFTALGSKAYDDLIAEHPPTKDQKSDGAVWNPDTFAPALVSACSVEPKIDNDSAVEVFASESWSRGELSDLFMAVVRLNAEGLDVPFGGNG